MANFLFKTILALLALTTCIFASPVPSTMVRRTPTNSVARAIPDADTINLITPPSKRDDVSSVLDIINTVINLVEDIFGAIDGADHDAESQFTQETVSQLLASYPDKNVMVVHSDYEYSFVNDEYYNVQLPLSLGRTYGYDVHVFDYGTFELFGDGGYINWAFGGSWTADGSSVTFYQY